jgi:hypothetical protein
VRIDHELFFTVLLVSESEYPTVTNSTGSELPPIHNQIAVTIVNPRSGSCGAQAALGLLAASGCTKSAYHPEGDLRSSWKSLAANAELGRVAA